MEQVLNQVRVGVALLVYNDRGEVLIGRRKSQHGEGHWSFPGGHMEPGETPELCAAREAMEEAGIEIAKLKIIGVTNDIFSPEKHYITIFVVGEHAGGIVRNCEPEKLESWQWRSLDDLPQPLFLPIVNLLAGPFAKNLRMPPLSDAA